MFDVIIAGDFALSGDVGLRVAGECRVQWDMGARTGLLHIASADPFRRVSPDVQRCVREGIAEVVDLARPVRTRLLVVHAPAVLTAFPPGLGGLEADRVVLVHDRSPPREDMGRMFGLMLGRMSWAPTNRWVRACLDALQLPLALEEMDWRPPVVCRAAREPPRLGSQRLTIGHVSFGGRSHWPGSHEALAALLPGDGSVDVRLLGRPPAALLPGKSVPEAWVVHDRGDISIDAFLDGIDALVYLPSGVTEIVPDAAIGAALAKRRLVVTLPHLRPHLGDGPVYCEPADAPAATIRILRGADLTPTLDRAATSVSFQFPRAFHAERIARLTGRPMAGPRVPAPPRANRAPRALFLASNGVGLGHVTRLLAIARRAAGRFEPVFVTHAQAIPLIRGHGYQTEYIPSLSDTAADPRLWDRWLRSELERLIFAYEADAVVFDGNNPTPGLIGAALSQPPCRLVWVRRGMSGGVASPHLANSRHFDLIIEPGEIAAERDIGATAGRRHEVLPVDPVTLLDPADLIDRADAARALGLDPARPAVLVQLGAGAHRNIVSLIDSVVSGLRQFADLQVVIAEWANSAAPLSLWPETVVVAGYPLGRYLRAFDFCISAAGYNTFHEAMAFGMPTVFIATSHVAVDDQRARARYAQDMGAALDLPEDSLFQLPAICSVMLDPRAREVIRQRCGLLARPNGAAAAAQAIGDLLRGP